MNIRKISDRFSASTAGSDAFKFLAHDAFELMKEDKDNAAVYFVIGSAARSFVMRYEDQGLTNKFVADSKAVMRELIELTLVALDSAPSERLGLFGDIAWRYQWEVMAF